MNMPASTLRAGELGLGRRAKALSQALFCERFPKGETASNNAAIDKCSTRLFSGLRYNFFVPRCTEAEAAAACQPPHIWPFFSGHMTALFTQGSDDAT